MNMIKNKKKLVIVLISIFAMSAVFAAVALAGSGIEKEKKTDEPVAASVTVTETTAVLLAIEAVDPNSKLVNVSLEDENGTFVYEVVLAFGGKNIEVEVDATTGAIVTESEDSDGVENEDDGSLKTNELEDDGFDGDSIDWQEKGESENQN